MNTNDHIDPVYAGDAAPSWRGLIFAVILIAAMLFCIFNVGGCAARVGTKVKTTPKAGENNNGAPNTLTLADADGTWNVNSAGPARYTEVSDGSIVTVQHGSTPRDIVWDGQSRRLAVSSGSDISAASIEVNPETGWLKAKDVKLGASEPIRAGNEAFDRLIQYWAALSQQSADVAKRELEAIENVSPTVASVIKDILRASGVPIP